MIIVPFLFFLILTIYWWEKHKGVDICVYMSALYTISTLFAALVYFTDSMEGTDGGTSGGMLWAGWEPILGIVPTVLFCGLLALSMLPFYYINTRDIKIIECKSPRLLLAMSALLIFVALINLYCVAGSTMEILSGDLIALRQSSFDGDETPADLKIASLPFPLGYIMYFRLTTILALPIMFYNMCFCHRPWWWNALLLFTSTTPILAGLQRADRTEPVFFALVFVYCILFFRHSFSKRVKYVMTSMILVFAVTGISYLTFVSMARFQDRKNGGAIMSVAQYTGQGYLNFCYFWEYANPNELATEREFPIFNHIVKKVDSTPDRRGERSAKQGFFISVFATFIGDLMLDIGVMGMIIWVLLYAFIVTSVIKWKHRETYDISEVLILYILASIPLFGIFYYRYFAWMLAFNFVFVAAYRFFSVYKIVLVGKKKDDTQSLTE